jgi:transcriptional regulator of arginine metabolism
MIMQWGRINMQKAERQQLIRDLIRREEVHSQTELTAKLAKAGLSATQASVSRDLDEMGIVKVHGIYALHGLNGRGSEFGPVALQAVGTNLIVAKTMSGLASAVTVRIDSAGIPGVVGTIAGDDTIFIAVENQKTQLAALRQIKGVFN